MNAIIFSTLIVALSSLGFFISTLPCYPTLHDESCSDVVVVVIRVRTVAPAKVSGPSPPPDVDMDDENSSAELRKKDRMSV